MTGEVTKHVSGSDVAGAGFRFELVFVIQHCGHHDAAKTTPFTSYLILTVSHAY